MFSDNTIKKRVMAVVEARITKAQQEYDEECRILDDKVHQEIQQLHARREFDGQKLADGLVDEVLGFNKTQIV